MSQRTRNASVAEYPSIWAMAWFAFRAKALQARRTLRDVPDRLARLATGSLAEFPFVIAESVAPLDMGTDPRERPLLLGKYQNLRLACRHINRRVLPTGKTFSFWRQVGPPWKLRGFKAGREVREGCIIPTTGGGLCQLSGSLLEAALQFDLEILERHRHTALPAEIPYDERRDATLFWNYVDLRFRAREALLIEAFLTADSLVVRLRAKAPRQARIAVANLAGRPMRPQPCQDIQSCLVCGKTDCVRCRTPSAVSDRHDTTKTIYLVDQYQPEFDAYIQGRQQACDTLLLPARIGRNRRGWTTEGFGATRSFLRFRLQQSFALRRAVARGATVAQTHFELAETLAGQYAAHIEYDTENLCISQALLPHLWRLGVLGGRRFDVLMYREPLTRLEKNLDAALQLYPDCGTLAEFRSPPGFAELEQEALKAARTLITPHAQIASLFSNTLRLNWAPAEQPTGAAKDDRARDIILFCGPTLARKGAHAVREAVRSMGFTLTVLGSDLEGKAFWKDLPVVHRTPETLQWDRIYAVLQPALFEYWPRNLLRAHAGGAKLIISPGCGIDENKEAGIHHVPFGAPDVLITNLESLLVNKGEVKCE